MAANPCIYTLKNGKELNYDQMRKHLVDNYDSLIKPIKIKEEQVAKEQLATKEVVEPNKPLKIPKEVKENIKKVVIENTELPSKLTAKDIASLGVDKGKEYKISSGEEKIFKKLIDCIWD